MTGDFKSGKKLNLRKIVPFVASNYRRDKIWLRRQRPERRDYSIFVCIDNSRSVVCAEAAQDVVDSVLTLINAVRMAELGRVEVTTFGEDVRVLVGL